MKPEKYSHETATRTLKKFQSDFIQTNQFSRIHKIFIKRQRTNFVIWLILRDVWWTVVDVIHCNVLLYLYVHNKCLITKLVCHHFILRNLRVDYFPSTYLYPCFSGRTPAEWSATCGTCATSSVIDFLPAFHYCSFAPPSPPHSLIWTSKAYFIISEDCWNNFMQ